MAGTIGGCHLKIYQKFCAYVGKISTKCAFFVFALVCLFVLFCFVFLNEIIKPLFYSLLLLFSSYARKKNSHSYGVQLVPLKPKRERNLNVKREEEIDNQPKHRLRSCINNYCCFDMEKAWNKQFKIHGKQTDTVFSFPASL